MSNVQQAYGDGEGVDMLGGGSRRYLWRNLVSSGFLNSLMHAHRPLPYKQFHAYKATQRPLYDRTIIRFHSSYLNAASELIMLSKPCFDHDDMRLGTKFYDSRSLRRDTQMSLRTRAPSEDEGSFIL